MLLYSKKLRSKRGWELGEEHVQLLKNSKGYGNQVKWLWSNRAVKILLFYIHNMKDVRAGENQTRRMKKDVQQLLLLNTVLVVFSSLSFYNPLINVLAYKFSMRFQTVLHYLVQ